MPSPYVVDEFPRFPSQHPLSLRALQSSLALFMSPCSRGVREEEREANRGESWDWVITILLCISIMGFLYMFFFFFFVHSGEVNELWLVTVHISVTLCHSHIITHRQRHTDMYVSIFTSRSLPWFMKHFQSAVDKLEDDSMLDPMIPISLCACSHVLNMCRFCTVSAAALQGLKKLYVAYTRYITNGTNSVITHLTGNKTQDVVTLIFIILRVSSILKIKANFSQAHLSM